MASRSNGSRSSVVTMSYRFILKISGSMHIIWIGKRGAELMEWNGIAEFSGWKPDVVWNRRLSAPNLDVDLHSADVRFAARESASYLDAFNSICRADVSK